jgi:hypothetical protein
MSGERQHFLPRFLLKGFSSRSVGDQVYVWAARKNAATFEANIANVGVAKDFYGESGQGTIDEAITDTESNFAALIESLRAETQTTPISNATIADFVTHLMIRTKHLRDAFLDSYQHLSDCLLNLMADPASLQQMMNKYIRENPDHIRRGFDNILKKTKLSKKQKMRLSRSISDLATQHILRPTRNIAPLFDELNEVMQERLPAVVKDGHCQALMKAVVPEPRAVEYRKLHWYLITPMDGDMVLGDLGPLTEEMPGNNFRVLPSDPDKIRRIFLPISSRQVVLGTREESAPKVVSKPLNAAIASHSQEFLIGCSRSLVEENFPVLGTRSALITEREMEILRKDLITELRD